MQVLGHAARTWRVGGGGGRFRVEGLGFRVNLWLRTLKFRPGGLYIYPRNLLAAPSGLS